MKKVSLANLRRVTIASLGVYILFYYLILNTFSSMTDLSRTFSNILTLLGEGAGILIIVIGIRWQDVRHKKEWKVFAWGIGMNLLGDFIWATYEILLKQEVPNPSLGDFFILLVQYFICLL